MVTEAPEPVRRRRHGQELESALLTAALDELVKVGYARMTMESVAKRAGTSEPVLYRRWPNKDQLVLAAMEHYRDANPIALPDTGALRSDLLAELTMVSEARAGILRHHRGRRLLRAAGRHRPHSQPGPRTGHGWPAAPAPAGYLSAGPRPR